MPIIAPQHAWKEKDHVPLPDWPDDCFVQWGGKGVVLSDKPDGSYGTAFFEAFPDGGGFIRGEGATIAEAELAALAKLRKETACPHLWGRGRYLNGGAVCRRCGTFRTMFQPVVQLGDWKRPLDAGALSILADGCVRPDGLNRHRHRWWLKARRMGVGLPDFRTAPPEPGLFDPPDDYAKACRHAVGAWLRDNLDKVGAADGGLAGLFDALGRRSLERLRDEILQEETDLAPEI